VGDTVAFKCDISGNPIPSGTWYKGKTQLKDEGRTLIETSEDFSELEIESVEKSDEGEYTCVVKNDFGEDKCSVTLTVEGKNGDVVTHVYSQITSPSLWHCVTCYLFCVTVKCLTPGIA